MFQVVSKISIVNTCYSRYVLLQCLLLVMQCPYVEWSTYCNRLLLQAKLDVEDIFTIITMIEMKTYSISTTYKL